MPTKQTIEAAIQSKPKDSAILKFYKRYEHLPAIYAKQIFDYEKYGYERQDIVQDLRIKLYTSIISYAEKLAEFKATGRYEPVPIEFYIKSALANKVRDFVRMFNTNEVANANKVSIDGNFDYSIYDDMMQEMDISKNVFVINGVNLLEHLQNKEKLIFVMHLKGYTLRDIKRKLHKVPDIPKPELVIKTQMAYLQTKKAELMQFNTKTYKKEIMANVE